MNQAYSEKHEQTAFDAAIEAKIARVSRGEEVEFEPEEAETLGAFVETALTEEEAREARFECADQYANA